MESMRASLIRMRLAALTVALKELKRKSRAKAEEDRIDNRRRR